jgi:hypothetical protein
MFKSRIESQLDAEILSVLEQLATKEKTDEDYGTLVDRLSKLHKLKSEEKSGLKPPSLDTVLIVSANIFGILWIARYEREDAEVIKAPNAFRMILRPR